MADRDDMRQQLKIDKYSLDDELISQPQRYEQVGEESARAASRRDKAHDDCRVKEAELAVRIRRELEGAGEKVTETRIVAEVNQHRERIAARNLYLAASEEAEMWQALKEAFSQRTYMLRDLCSLYAAGYFTRSSVTAGTTSISDRKYEDTKSRLAAGRKRLE